MIQYVFFLICDINYILQILTTKVKRKYSL